MEVLVGGKALGQQLGADDLPVVEDEASGGLSRKEDVSHACDGERVDEADQDGGDDGEANGGDPHGVVGGRCGCD